MRFLDVMMKCRPILLPAIFSLLSPAVAAAQDSARFSVQGGVGTMLNVGANTQSVSFGFWPSERVGILVGAQRIHMPTEVEQFGDVTSVTRGGTTTFVSGELRWLPLTASRVSPYVLAGGGRGTARLNVNEQFPDPTTNSAMLFFFGGGVQAPVGRHLSVFGDVRMVGQLERDVPFLFVPARAGVVWRF